MKILIIPDLHNHINWVERLIAKESPDLTIYQGDYFDDFGDNPLIAQQTATWLKQSLHQPNRIHLFGNHDIDYCWPSNPYLYSPGFTLEKSKAINKVLSRKDWNKLKLFYIHDNWIFSHAGINKAELPYNPTVDITNILQLKPFIEKCEVDALANAANNQSHILLAYGTRMGEIRPGGVLWQDWSRFRPIPKINQIVGHTPSHKVRFKNIPNNTKCVSFNVCLDTANKYYGTLENGIFTHIRNIMI